jgi:predicted amidophosphoribosyltransferase
VAVGVSAGVYPAAAVSRWNAWIESLEETWLGWSLPPTRRVVAEAGWRPDPAQAYCPRCGVSAEPSEVGRDGCGSCRGRPAPADGVVRLGVYAGPLREWVRAIKYRRWSAMAGSLGRDLARSVATRTAAGSRLVVVPMPMPWARRLYRGIDHAREIAAAVAGELPAPLATALSRYDGPPQVTLTASARSRAGVGVRLRRRTRPLAGRTVVLVDDVCTTGASLRSATRLLRRLRPARVIAAVLAVADPPGRKTRV